MSRFVKLAAVIVTIMSVTLVVVGCGGSQGSTATTVAISGGPGAPPGAGSSTVQTGTGAYTLKDGEALTGGTYASTKADENTIRAEGDVTATLENVTVQKTAGAASSNDSSSFYGLNAAILALDNAKLTINGGVVTATAEGANGVFAYGNSTIHITGTTVNVSGGNAGGIEVSGGGTMYANDLTVNATVKAAIRSDRGGGTMVVDGGNATADARHWDT